MEYNHDILKDLIVEKDPTIKREDIYIHNILGRMGLGALSAGGTTSHIIMVDFHTKIMKKIHGMEKEFVQHGNHSIGMDEYNQRLTTKLRDDKLNDLGI
jgi:hypothetical protein